MEIESQRKLNTWEGYVDWRNRPALINRHGGSVAASFVLVVEVLENLAFLASASNLVMYLSEYMHFSPTDSANSVTNFMGTAFLLALLGGFLSDAFFTTYHIYLISAVIEFLVQLKIGLLLFFFASYPILERNKFRDEKLVMSYINRDNSTLYYILYGLVLLTIQARSGSLKPPKCSSNTPDMPCKQVHGAQAAMLFIGLYLVALGVGGIKGSLPPHGAEQFDGETPTGRKQRSTFFNYFVFSLSCGGLIAVTFVVWVEDNKGWQWGFGISTLAILFSIPLFLAGSPFYRNKIPRGSPLTTISKVLIAALLNSCIPRNSSSVIVVSMALSPSTIPVLCDQDGETTDSKHIESTEIPSKSLRFLNRAVANKSAASGPLKCSVQEVEEVKIVMKILPIFACTIMLNCCLAQLSTFSVQQAATMNTKFGKLKVPPASLPIFPVLFIMILAPIFDHLIIPFSRKITKTEMGISHLQRIGIGLFLSTVAMVIAALVEIKRKRVATDSGLHDSAKPLPITFFWIAFQYLFLGSADLFTLAGLLEFCFSEAPFSMRSLATSLSWASLAVGYYLSTVIVSMVNSITGNSKHQPWFSGSNLNHFHLERFYWLMCILSALNFMHYLYWATKFQYRSVRSSN